MRWAAYTAYLAGSLLFLMDAVREGAPILATGSALFALGTLLYIAQEIGRARRRRSDH